MSIATKCTCHMSSNGYCNSGVKECTQLMSENKYPIGGYAPGNYRNRCVTCERSFFGDKQAVQCEPCALKNNSTNEQLSGADQVCGKTELNNLSAIPVNSPGSSYQNLFDYLHEEHGLTLLESEMNDLINVLHKYHPGGAVWVRASEFKAHEPIYRPFRRKREDGEPEYDYGEIYVTEDNGEIFLDINNERSYEPQHFERWKDYEILDESGAPAAAREEDAVSFAQWLANERWQPRINTEWARYETIYSDVSVKTTAELYKLFKQQRANP